MGRLTHGTCPIAAACSPTIMPTTCSASASALEQLLIGTARCRDHRLRHAGPGHPPGRVRRRRDDDELCWTSPSPPPAWARSAAGPRPPPTPTAEATTEQTDLFGRQVYRSDLGGHVFHLHYDLAGRMTQRTGGETLNYTWLNTGKVAEPFSATGTHGAGTGRARAPTYGYDEAGNLVSECSTKAIGTTNLGSLLRLPGGIFGLQLVELYKNATATYDALEPADDLGRGGQRRRCRPPAPATNMIWPATSAAAMPPTARSTTTARRRLRHQPGLLVPLRQHEPAGHQGRALPAARSSAARRRRLSLRRGRPRLRVDPHRRRLGRRSTIPTMIPTIRDNGRQEYISVSYDPGHARGLYLRRRRRARRPCASPRAAISTMATAP